MTKVCINPQFGTIEDSKSINIRLDGLQDYANIRIKVENITNSSVCLPTSCLSEKASISNCGEYIYTDGKVTFLDFNINLNIPECSSHSISSIFINIEERNFNGETYELKKIYPVSYYIRKNNINNKVTNKYKNMFINPMFVDEDGFCSVSVDSSEDKLNLSINDRKFNILMNNEGKGSINFRGKEVLDDDTPIVKKFPINIILEEEEYFSGSYIYILPSSIATSADPRCDIPGFVFEVPDECLEPPSDPEDPDDPPGASVPPVDFPVKPNGSETSNNSIGNICRIQNFSSTLLTNGLTLNAFVGVDSSIIDISDGGYNKGRVFIYQDESSPDCRVISTERIIIPPKSIVDEFSIIVEKDIWERASDFETNDLLVVFFSEELSYRSYKVSGREVDEYVGYRLILSNTDDSFPTITIKEWLTCNLSIFYQRIISGGNDIAPSLDISGVDTLPFITDSNSNFVSIINVSIASNSKHIGEDSDEFYTYVIAEAEVENKKQLFLYSFSLNEDQTNFETFGWKQLTFEGNNSHPKIKIGKDNNLHIFWESDRSGVQQVYYGVLGQSFVSISNSAISSSLDKKSELLNKENKSFEYTAQDILIPFDEYSSVTPVINVFIEDKNNNGTISITDDQDINILGNTIEDTAIAFMPLFNDLNPSIDPILDGGFSQINYQIDLDFNGSINGDSFSISLEEGDINNLYEQWKSQFNVQIEETFENTPVYVKSSNKFVIDSQINIYDRIVPIVGSYKNENIEGLSNGSIISDDFELVFSGDDSNNNIKHYVIAVMPEKIRFKATNIQTFLEFCEDQGHTTTECLNYYIPEEEQIIYTGKYKLVVLLNSNENYYGSQYKKNFRIIRELPGIYDFGEIANIKMLVNYSKMSCEEKRSIFGEDIDFTPSLNDFLFSCSLTVLVDDQVEYSESFITDLSDKYRKFDLGFGIPSNGRFISNDFLPYETSIYDNINIDFNFNNIVISNPSFTFNEEIIDVPIYVRDMSRMIVEEATIVEAEEDECRSFYDDNDLLTLSLIDKTINLNPSQIADTTDNNNNEDFIQVPLTFEGINKSINLDLGECNDVHVVWESNRDKYWNIYYSNSIDKNVPFRIETIITNTKSNSLSPDISVNKNGNRMTTWHDDRDGLYKIYSARSLEGYNCECGNNNETIIVDNYSIDLCDINFPYTASLEGTNTYNYTMQFFTDNQLQNLYNTISSSDSVNGWKIDGIPMDQGGAELVFGDSVLVSYTPQDGDGIFDKILYIKVTIVLTT